VLLHIPPPAAAPLHALNVWISNDVIREREEIINGDPLNVHVMRMVTHDLTGDLVTCDTCGVWVLRNTDANAAVIARTSDRAWVDLNRNQECGGTLQSSGAPKKTTGAHWNFAYERCYDPLNLVRWWIAELRSLKPAGIIDEVIFRSTMLVLGRPCWREALDGCFLPVGRPWTVILKGNWASNVARMGNARRASALLSGCLCKQA